MNVAGQRRRQQAVTAGTIGDDEEHPHVENEMMIDEEQPVLEAQTSKAVEELKSTVQYQ